MIFFFFLNRGLDFSFREGWPETKEKGTESRKRRELEKGTTSRQ